MLSKILGMESGYFGLPQAGQNGCRPVFAVAAPLPPQKESQSQVAFQEVMAHSGAGSLPSQSKSGPSRLIAGMFKAPAVRG